MFNHFSDGPRGGFGQGHGGQQQQHSQNLISPLGVSQYPRFGIHGTGGASSSAAAAAQDDSYGGMDWEPAPSPFGMAGTQAPDGVELQDMDMSSTAAHAGVANLIAQFENRGAPVMTARATGISSPPSPRQQQQPSQPTTTTTFGNGTFATAGAGIASPTMMAASPQPLPHPHHHNPHAPTTPALDTPTSVASPAQLHFGNLDSVAVGGGNPFKSDSSELVGSPSTSHFGSIDSSFKTEAGLASPTLSTFGHVNAAASSSRVKSPMAGTMQQQGFFRPPVPQTPKPLVPQHRGPASFAFVSDGINGGGSVQVVHHGPMSSASAASTSFSPQPTIPPQIQTNLIPQSPSNFSGLTPNSAKSPFTSQSPLVTYGLAGPSPMPSPFVTSPTVPTPTATTFPAPPPLPERRRASAQLTQLQTARAGSVALRPQTGTRPSREQVPAEAWESYKHTIKQLYLEERRPLKEVMSIMAERYGFQATPKMYKTRFSQWGFVKNNTEDEVKRLLSMKFQRDAEGKVSEFVRNGRVVNLGTYLKRKGVTEYDLVDFETPADLPAYVRCRTPTPPPAPGYLRSPDLLRAQETVVGNMRKAFLHCRQFEVETGKVVGWTSLMLWGCGSSEMLYDASKLFERGEHDQAGHLLMRAFKQLELDLKQLSPQGIKELLLGMVHRDPGMMTALSKYLAAYCTTNFERPHPLRQIFCCLYDVQQRHGPATLSELVWGCIPTVAEELEAAYGRRHPYVARTWIDLAVFYGHADPERIDKVVGELAPVRRAVEQQDGANSPEDLCLRYGIVQLMNAAYPTMEATRAATAELWEAMRLTGQVYRVRGPEHNVFCYHSIVKVDPYSKRARDRYEAMTAFILKHCDVKVLPYFEEDMHHVVHATDPQESWASAVHSSMLPPSRWTLI